jgi:hypothetical protein
MRRPKLVFGCGCDRSGTTVLGRELYNIITSSFLVPECYFFHDVMMVGDIESMDDLSVILDNSHRYQVWKKVEGLPELSDFRKRNILLSLILHNYPEAKSCSYIIDTTPISYVWKILDREFCNDYYMQIVRDARSTATSLLNMSWGPVHSGKALEYWAERVSLARSVVTNEIAYSDLISTPSGLIPEKIKEFLGRNGIEFDGSYFGVTQPIDTLPSFTRKQHKLLSAPLDNSKSKVESDRYIDYFYDRNISVRNLNGDAISGVQIKRNKTLELIEYARAFTKYVRMLILNYGHG